MENRSLIPLLSISLAMLLAACAERAPVAPRVDDRAAAAFPRFTAAGALADPATPGVRRDAAAATANPAGLLWQNTRTGRVVRWTLNADGTYAGTFAELHRVPPYTYAAEAAADFNGDGNPDLVWKNTSTGTRSIWLMLGAYWYSYANLPNPGAAWDVAAAADFDRDGKPDLVLRNHDTGEVRIHKMDGTAWTATEWVLPTQPAGYRLVGAGDFDGDGNPDLVWEDPATGAHWLWLMDGTAWNGRRADIWTAPAYWRVDAVGDANGDGKPDLAWTNTGTGERVIWLMDGVAWHGAY
ncbi:MAG: VCBS repeat-containing protein, partial [Gemmatimonadetes bacterium]|nr:VCBS repeat-containing protein [Gemmatimonadota bacterium]